VYVALIYPIFPFFSSSVYTLITQMLSTALSVHHLILFKALRLHYTTDQYNSSILSGYYYIYIYGTKFKNKYVVH